MAAIAKFGTLRFAHRKDRADWICVGHAPDGTHVWERVFAGSKAGEAIRVRVVRSDEEHEPRIMFTMMLDTGDRVPHIPSAVRREARQFARSLALRKAA